MPDTKTPQTLNLALPLNAALLSSLTKKLAKPAAVHASYKMSAADRADYLALLNGEQPSPIPHEQANRILDALWSIMVAFVDLEFPPAPTPAAPCGQIPSKSGGKCDKASGAMLSSPHSETAPNHKASKASGIARVRGES